jgi:hypothetical protein
VSPFGFLRRWWWTRTLEDARHEEHLCTRAALVAMRRFDTVNAILFLRGATAAKRRRRAAEEELRKIGALAGNPAA